MLRQPGLRERAVPLGTTGQVDDVVLGLGGAEAFGALLEQRVAVRDIVRARLGKSKMPPVDYTRLLPLTYFVILVGGAVSLLTLAADIVNPIRLG